MKKHVIDASALLALLGNEKGSDKAIQYLPNCVMSSVNYSEIITVLIRKGVPESEVITIANDLVGEVVDFDKDQSIEVAKLSQQTKGFGLSLGDKACLTLGKSFNLPIITADKIWKQLKGFDVHLIR